jgi:hypothetical protein
MNDYWALHKKTYLSLFDELDPEIRREIENDPYGEAAEELNEKVKNLVEKQLTAAEE